MAIIRGTGATEDDPIVVNDYFSLYDAIKAEKKYIELDPDDETKIIDMNDYPIGTIGITNNGCDIFSKINLYKIEGNGWTIKNLWAIDLLTNGSSYYGFSYNPVGLTVNRLNLLNLFVSSNLSTSNNFQIFKMGSTVYLNDCKFTILSTGNDVNFFNTSSNLYCNRCSFTIKSLNTSFTLCNASDKTVIFRNCNFRLNIKNLNKLLYHYSYGGGSDSLMRYFSLEFCKFSGIIHNGQLLSNYVHFSSDGKKKFLNNIWQLNFENNEEVKISDSVLTLVNSDVSNMKPLDDSDSNTLLCTKEELLDINFLNEKGFPVMFKENIIEGEV